MGRINILFSNHTSINFIFPYSYKRLNAEQMISTAQNHLSCANSHGRQNTRLSKRCWRLEFWFFPYLEYSLYICIVPPLCLSLSPPPPSSPRSPPLCLSSSFLTHTSLLARPCYPCFFWYCFSYFPFFFLMDGRQENNYHTDTVTCIIPPLFSVTYAMLAFAEVLLGVSLLSKNRYKLE